MTGLKIAAQTRSLAQSIKKALHTAASLGCDGVQIEARSELQPAELSDTGLRQMRKIMDDLNLRVSSIAFPTRRGYSNPVDLQPRVEATLAAMRMASRLRSRTLIGNLGPLPETDTTEFATLLDAIENLSKQGDHLGVQLVMQTTTPFQQLESFLAGLPTGSIAVDLHPASLIAHGESPAEFVATVGQYVAHVHASDGVYDLGTGQGVEVELGRGSADIPELLGMLEEFEYRDWLTVERRHSSQPVVDIGNAVKYLRAL